MHVQCLITPRLRSRVSRSVRPILIASSVKQQLEPGEALRPIALASTAVFFISALINGAALASVKFACTATFITTVAAEVILRDTGGPTTTSKDKNKQHTPKSPGSVPDCSSNSNKGTTASSGNLAAQSLPYPLHPGAIAAAGAVVLSALMPPEELPALSSMCLLAYVATSARKAQTSTAQQQETAPQQAPPAIEQSQELQQQLQRQTDKVQNLSSKVQQLERELKAARKGGRKLDNVQQQLKQEQAEKQDLALKLLLMERQLQTTKEQLAAGQAAARNRSREDPAGLSQAAAVAGAAPEKQQQQQAQDKAGAGGGKLVVAFVGGRTMKESDRKLLPHDVGEVRFFGSPRDTGLGDLKRLEAAIKAGSIDQVYMQTRWNGHTTTQTITRLCKDRGIPCFLLDAAGKARRKSEWAESTSSSDGELGWESG